MSGELTLVALATAVGPRTESHHFSGTFSVVVAATIDVTLRWVARETRRVSFVGPDSRLYVSVLGGAIRYEGERWGDEGSPFWDCC